MDGHGEDTFNMDDTVWLWLKCGMKANLHYIHCDPQWCWASLFQLKKGIWLSSRGSAVKQGPVISRTTLIWAHQGSSLSA